MKFKQSSSPFPSRFQQFPNDPSDSNESKSLASLTNQISFENSKESDSEIVLIQTPIADIHLQNDSDPVIHRLKMTKRSLSSLFQATNDLIKTTTIFSQICTKQFGSVSN
jgi:hypothetical protein